MALRMARALAGDALKILKLGGVSVICPVCGSKQLKPCYGHGPMPTTHPGRDAVARDQLAVLLTEIIGEDE